MNVRHTLICFLLLTLRDGNSGLTNAQNLDRTETEGGNITVGCSFLFPGGRKMFCQGKCEARNILVETTGDSEQSGRYSIRYLEGYFPVSETVLYVSITKLTKSDAGRYQCGLEDRPFLVFDSHQDFEIRVTDASPERITQPQQGQTAPAGHGVVLYVRLTLVVMVIVLSASVLIFCRKRARKPRETADEAEYVNVTEADRECEEVREEDRGSRSPPTEDDPSKLTCFEEELSLRAGPSPHSAPCGDPDNVLYFVLWADRECEEVREEDRGSISPVEMSVLSTSHCRHFSEDTLREGNSGLTNAQKLDRTETEGADITVACSFLFPGGRKMFCKGKCEEGNILVETTGDSEQSGRYSIRYEEGAFPVRGTTLYLSITKLTKSDAGRYQCSLDRSVFNLYQDIEIRVTDAPASLTSAPSASTLTTTKSLSSIPSSASPERTTQPQQGQTAPAGHGVVLYVRLTLVVMVIVLSASVLIFCRKRARKPRETADEAEYVNVTEADRECEEVREEDRGSRSPPIEMSVLSTSHCRHFSEDSKQH
ncbi:hypothetical protein JOQ06_007008 [Pogonophryne albipinna]|uniref:Immunoglobulin domain-containing protein n=1 Tax=Pogonophryne albipinna TaxID=1090488 RepID=A0AAD6B217_9TELE|nr:hypothetical protein JOQ06_007008 [Pogonophryne albipinna]